LQQLFDTHGVFYDRDAAGMTYYFKVDGGFHGNAGADQQHPDGRCADAALLLIPTPFDRRCQQLGLRGRLDRWVLACGAGNYGTSTELLRELYHNNRDFGGTRVFIHIRKACWNGDYNGEASSIWAIRWEWRCERGRALSNDGNGV